MRSSRRLALLVGILMLLMIAGSTAVFAQEPVVNAVLFFSPTCPACHQVMTNDLPPLKELYGERLQILEVNVLSPDGGRIYGEYLQQYNVPDDKVGVPALVVGDLFMVGTAEIPQLFPPAIEANLAAGGLDWPPLTGVTEYLENYGLSEGDKPGTLELFGQDPLGNSISVLVLIGMLISMVFLLFTYLNGKATFHAWPDWVVPVLAVVGLGVASYLAYVEITHNPAICGPVGDCNAVQGSKYATFAGIPVGLLGALGFLGILGAWALAKFGGPNRGHTGAEAMWWFALVGVLFSIYLTYLEPFVIGATCAWCITSAIAMTLILWAATPVVLAEAEQPVRGKKKKKSKKRATAQRTR